MVKVEKPVFLNIGRRDILITQILSHILVVSSLMLFEFIPSFEVFKEERISFKIRYLQDQLQVPFQLGPI